MSVKIKVDSLKTQKSADGAIELYSTTEKSETVLVETFINQGLADRFLKDCRVWQVLDIPEEKLNRKL